MADAQIEILIKVVDDFSKRLNDIEKSVTDTSKVVKEQSKSISDGFNTSTNALLALGNAASSFDNILSTSTNTIIRLENAQDRLLNSQDRLEDSQRKLNTLSEQGKEGTEEYADAQREHERATRNLSIAQNNLERVQGQLIGTYINLGIQTITLIASLPKLAESVNKVLTVTKSLNIAEAISLGLKNPLLLAAGLAAAAAGAYAIKQIMAADSTEQFNSAQSSLTSSSYVASDAINLQTSALSNLDSKMQEIINGPMEGELELNKKIAEQTLRYTEAQGTEYEKREKVKLNSLKRDKEVFDAKRGILNAEAKLEIQTNEIAQGAQIKSFNERLQAIHDFATEAINELQPVRQIQIDIANFEKNQRTYSRGTTQTSQAVKLPTQSVDPKKWTVSPDFNSYLSAPTTRNVSVTLELNGKEIARAQNEELRNKMFR